MYKVISGISISHTKSKGHCFFQTNLWLLINGRLKRQNQCKCAKFPSLQIQGCSLFPTKVYDNFKIRFQMFQRAELSFQTDRLKDPKFSCCLKHFLNFAMLLCPLLFVPYLSFTCFCSSLCLTHHLAKADIENFSSLSQHLLISSCSCHFPCLHFTDLRIIATKFCFALFLHPFLFTYSKFHCKKGKKFSAKLPHKRLQTQIDANV